MVHCARTVIFDAIWVWQGAVRMTKFRVALDTFNHCFRVLLRDPAIEGRHAHGLKKPERTPFRAARTRTRTRTRRPVRLGRSFLSDARKWLFPEAEVL